MQVLSQRRSERITRRGVTGFLKSISVSRFHSHCHAAKHLHIALSTGCVDPWRDDNGVVNAGALAASLWRRERITRQNVTGFLKSISVSRFHSHCHAAKHLHIALSTGCVDPWRDDNGVVNVGALAASLWRRERITRQNVTGFLKSISVSRFHSHCHAAKHLHIALSTGCVDPWRDDNGVVNAGALAASLWRRERITRQNVTGFLKSISVSRFHSHCHAAKHLHIALSTGCVDPWRDDNGVVNVGALAASLWRRERITRQNVTGFLKSISVSRFHSHCHAAKHLHIALSTGCVDPWRDDKMEW